MYDFFQDESMRNGIAMKANPKTKQNDQINHHIGLLHRTTCQRL